MNPRCSQFQFLLPGCWITLFYLLLDTCMIEALERNKPYVKVLDDIIRLNKEAIPKSNTIGSGFGIVSRWRKGINELYEKDMPLKGDIIVELFDHNAPHYLLNVSNKTFIQWKCGDDECNTWQVNQKHATTDAYNKQMFRIDNRLRSILNSYPAEQIVKRAQSQLSNIPTTVEEDDNCEDFTSWCVFSVDKGVASFVFDDEVEKIYKKSQEQKVDIRIRIRVVDDLGTSYTNPTVDILNILGESLASDKTTKKVKEEIGVKPHKLNRSSIWKYYGLMAFKQLLGAVKPADKKKKLNGFKANAKEMVDTNRIIDTFNSGVIYNTGSMESKKPKSSGKNFPTGVFETNVHTWTKGDIWICVAPSHEREALMTYHLKMEDYLNQQKSNSNVTLVLNSDTAQDVRYE